MLLPGYCYHIVSSVRYEGFVDYQVPFSPLFSHAIPTPCRPYLAFCGPCHSYPGPCHSYTARSGLVLARAAFIPALAPLIQLHARAARIQRDPGPYRSYPALS
eukprot:3284615-Rhodomonas_salina.4